MVRRGFLIALLLSALLHLLVLAAPGWNMGNLLSDDAAPLPLEAHLLATAEKPLTAARPAPRKAARAAPVPAPVETAPPAVAEKAPPELPPPEEAKPEEPPVQEALAETPEPIAAAPEIAPPLPRSGRIRYSIMRGDGGFIVGQSIHEWRHDGKRYVMSATSETTGIAALFKPARVVQTSEGGFLKGELKPEHFRFDRGDNDVVTASFDWQARQVRLGDGQVVSIADGAEDFLSMFYQLMQAAQRGEGFVMAVATGKKIERYAFEWMGEDELTLKPGKFRAWHVRVRAADGGKDTTEVWLAQEMAGLPVKIRNTNRKGEIFDQVAEEIEYEGK